MNEMLNDSLAFDCYSNDVKRGEATYRQQAAIDPENSGLRAKLAVTLVSLAAHLQPNLTIEVQQPAQPAAA